jgi:hypothetical protein
MSEVGMSNWVEELKPEDDVHVEIIYPPEYVQKNLDTIGKYTSSITLMCRAAAVLEEAETSFLIKGMTVVQVYAVEKALRKFGIKLTHDIIRKRGLNYVHFHADIRELLEKMKHGEIL